MVTTGRDQDVQIDPAKLEKAIVKYGVGSILNVKDQALPLEQWHDIIRKIQEPVRNPLKIPVIYALIRFTAANYERGSTLYPQEIGWLPHGIRL